MEEGVGSRGRNPSSPAGEYFRANVWSWRPIHALVCELCSDLLDEETLEGMGYNNRAGAADQPTCTEMANRFEQWMEHNVHRVRLDIPGAKVTEEGRFVTEEELVENPDLETHTPYNVEDEHLKEWIEFLRHCGGFEAW
jgi:hypothetical protein